MLSKVKVKYNLRHLPSWPNKILHYLRPLILDIRPRSSPMPISKMILTRSWLHPASLFTELNWFLRYNINPHALIIQRLRLSKIDNVKSHSSALLILNWKIKPLMMPSCVNINPHIQIILLFTQHSHHI